MNKSLIEQFESYVANCIDEKGVYPFPMFTIDKDDKLIVSALAINADVALEKFWLDITCHCAKEVILGLDRATKEGQGTEFADVLTCFHWKDWSDSECPPERNNWSHWFKYGVINYQHEPRIVRPMDWKNEFWNGRMEAELSGCQPRTRISIKKIESGHPEKENVKTEDKQSGEKGSGVSGPQPVS